VNGTERLELYDSRVSSRQGDISNLKASRYPSKAIAKVEVAVKLCDVERRMLHPRDLRTSPYEDKNQSHDSDQTLNI